MMSALWLGILQGISEFLPISSSGHLALAGILFGLEDAGLTLNVLLHAGTLLATIVVLHRRLGEAVFSGVRALFAPQLFRTTRGGQDALFVIVASVPTAIIGLTVRDWVDSWTRSPFIVGIGFLATGLLLVATRYFRQGSIEHPGVKMALLLGVAQGIAVLPGISRSGITIALALYLGVARGRAFELSMLMSIPAVAGAALVELPHAAARLNELPTALFGAGVACVFGVGAMLLLRRVVVGGMFPLFALWVFPLAVATLFLSAAWPG